MSKWKRREEQRAASDLKRAENEAVARAEREEHARRHASVVEALATLGITLREVKDALAELPE